MSTVAFDVSDQVALTALRELAEQAARAGGELAASRFGQRNKVRLKNDRSEVSEADEAAQKRIIELIHAARPADAFIGEEQFHDGPDLPAPAPDRLCWVIDPIDGTRNFVRGLAGYCCSVGLMYGGHPIVGAVYDPTFDVMYSAAAGQHMTINGDPLPKPGEPGYPHRHPHRLVIAIPSTATGRSKELAHRCLDEHIVRNMGSAALHLVYVATGQYDAALSGNSRLWDLAAGAVLVEAVGGTMTGPDGTPLFPFDVATYNKEEVPNLAALPEARARLLKD